MVRACINRLPPPATPFPAPNPQPFSQAPPPGKYQYIHYIHNIHKSPHITSCRLPPTTTPQSSHNNHVELEKHTHTHTPTWIRYDYYTNKIEIANVQISIQLLKTNKRNDTKICVFVCVCVCSGGPTFRAIRTRTHSRTCTHILPHKLHFVLVT